ncbi:MAG: hypothetical protein MUC94_16060 [bacterium]|nr:hypothetical protein [bacterium]
MKRTSIIIIISFLIFGMNAVVTASSPGKAGYDFLRTHVGARPSAMAGAFISMTGDIHSIYFNPAGLATIPGRSATATYLNHVLDFQSGFIAYTQLRRPTKTDGRSAIFLQEVSH